jgi:hypothetical protein
MFLPQFFQAREIRRFRKVGNVQVHKYGQAPSGACFFIKKRQRPNGGCAILRRDKGTALSASYIA